MRVKTWIHIAAFIIPIGVLSVSLGARAVANTAELSHSAVPIEMPESAELCAAGTILMGMAASAQRVMRRRNGTV